MRFAKPKVPAELQPYLKQLNSRQKKRREEALASARLLSPDQLFALATAATKQVKWISLRNKIFNPIFWLLAILPAALDLLFHTGSEVKADRPLWLTMSMMVGFPFAIYLIHGLMEPSRLFLALRDLIAESQDSCLLGPALDLQMWGEVTTTNSRGTCRQYLLPAVEQMVRQMEPGEYADLTAPQKERLLRWLDHPLDNPELSFALLEMLNTVCDYNATYKVAQLAQKKGTAPKQKRLYEAARQCLVAMQYESAREQQAQVLLRASNANANAAPDTLLRPAAGTTVAIAPEHLLRATDPPPSPGER